MFIHPLYPTMDVLQQIFSYSHRHSLLKEAVNASTSKVYPTECFAIYGVLYIETNKTVIVAGACDTSSPQLYVLFKATGVGVGSM